MKVMKQRINKNRAPKPFKSGLRVNTVKGVTINPHTGKPAYSFEEDDSVVHCDICVVVEEIKTVAEPEVVEGTDCDSVY